MALREQAVDRSLREALGDRVDDPALPGIVSRLRGVAQAQTYAGRPLASAWAAQPWPQQPHLGLWHATAVLREWRGDGHLAVLVQAGFAPTEAVVFHEASHPDPAVRKRGWAASSPRSPAAGARSSGSRRPGGSPTAGCCGSRTARRR
ncbi:hypothetical protein GCM10025872_16080 [Barrientosiimonas endolithica]|uniref:Uncharacterized protein n=1 Tax=Barrientosiimonas endolithica TaxID=1535208 RepID=A0ABM8HAJ0_9MICO|nr:hypothetical protein GCM10025872_16080 [Barrientosiimonas endolithica]